MSDSFCEGATEHLTLMEAIHKRHSVRAYKDQPIDEEAREILEKAIAFINEDAYLNIQLVLEEPRAFTGFKGRLAGFSGVRNYFALVGPEVDNLDRALGYNGEKLVLIAQSLGLNTCWVGATYRMVNRDYGVDLGQKMCGVITLGYGVDQGKPHASKAPEEIGRGYDGAPQWFRDGVDAALLAPSARNQQKFSFALDGMNDDGVPLVRCATKHGSFTQIDLGIAQCHFEIGAAENPFLWAE